MNNTTISGIDLIKAVKPLLSSTPIMRANIEMAIDDIGVLTVKFIVTPDIIRAMAGESFLHLKPDAMDGI